MTTLVTIRLKSGNSVEVHRNDLELNPEELAEDTFRVFTGEESIRDGWLVSGNAVVSIDSIEAIEFDTYPAGAVYDMGA